MCCACCATDKNIHIRDNDETIFHCLIAFILSCSLKRLFYYWNGVPRETSSVAPVDFRTSAFLATSILAIWGVARAIRQKQPGAWLFAGLMIFYPAIYYFVYPHARYRHPIEAELTILIVYLLSEVSLRTTMKQSKARAAEPSHPV